MSKRNSTKKDIATTIVENDSITIEEPKENGTKYTKLVKEDSQLNFELNVLDGPTRPSNTTMPTTYELDEPELKDKDDTIKIVTYNLASIRAASKKGFLEYVKAEDPDILCLQETKLQIEPNLKDGFALEQFNHRYWWCSTAKKGYSGVAIVSKFQPINTIYGFPQDKDFDVEGRVLTLEFAEFYLINCYVPNAGEKLIRLDYRLKWDKAMLVHLNSLEETGKKIVYCGDLNVAHHAIDLARPKENLRSAGFTIEERNSFSAQLDDPNYPRVDVDRHLHPNEPCRYTFFSYRAGARSKGTGWRLDYFILSKSLLDKVVDCKIRFDCYGASDHIPSVLWLQGVKPAEVESPKEVVKEKRQSGQTTLTSFFKKVK